MKRLLNKSTSGGCHAVFLEGQHAARSFASSFSDFPALAKVRTQRGLDGSSPVCNSRFFGRDPVLRLPTPFLACTASNKRRGERGKGCGWLRRAQGRRQRRLAAGAALEVASPWHTTSYWSGAFRHFSVAFGPFCGEVSAKRWPFRSYNRASAFWQLNRASFRLVEVRWPAGGW